MYLVFAHVIYFSASEMRKEDNLTCNVQYLALHYVVWWGWGAVTRKWSQICCTTYFRNYLIFTKTLHMYELRPRWSDLP